MAMNRIQFQPCLSMSRFIQQFGTESQCESALEKARWPSGFVCPRCYTSSHSKVGGRMHTLFQCQACRYQTSLSAGTVMQGTKLPLTTWFLAIYKTGLSALALKRHLGVSYPSAWLMHHKLMHAMTQRKDRYTLEGQVQVDDAYLGGERSGKAVRGSENKVSFIAAVALTDDGHPLRVNLSPLQTFSIQAVTDWARRNLAPGSTVLSDGLACFTGVIAAQCHHVSTVVGTRKPKDVPKFRWINTVLGNLKTSLNGSYHAFAFRKYAARYLAAFAYHFNRRFDLKTLHQRLVLAVANCAPVPRREICSAEVG